jgi:predicted lipoprotein with Yx(FWY)xxD motif
MRALTLFLIAAALAAGTADASPSGNARVAVRSTDYGRILVDGRGFALYAFTHDTRSRSTCEGACAKAWPPFVTRGRVTAAAGAHGGLVGTVRRPDGRRQVTYAGRPLYYYVGDKRAGQVLCQNASEFGGVWLVVRAGGRLVRGG